MHPNAVGRRLDSLPALAVQGKPINGLFRLLASPVVWEEAYGRIATNHGDATAGADGQSLDGFSRQRLQSIIDRVMTDTYRFTPARRVYIPKTNGKRPLGIPTGDDKLVQAAVALLLERVYEPVFSDRSHGFRGGRSCHTALDEIKRTWTGTVWFVEADIESFFDRLDHDRLLGLLARRIADKRLLRLIRGMLKAGYLEHWVFHRTYSGTPQGGVISPLLANIYLHELDEFMQATIEAFTSGGRVRRRNPEWMRLTYQIRVRRRRIDELAGTQGSESTITALKAEIRDLQEHQRSVPSGDPFDPGWRRMRYCRYADDFLIGIVGSREDAAAILRRVEDFLAGLGLRCKPEKTRVVKATEGVQFLAYEVRVLNSAPVRKIRRDGRYTYRRCGVGRVALYIPKQHVRAFCADHGYGDYDQMRSTSVTRRLHLDDAEIVLAFNAELRGLANYYALADAIMPLHRLGSITHRSLMATLAHKHRTTTGQQYRRLMQPDGRWAVRYMVKGKTRATRVWMVKDLNRKPRSHASVDQIATATWLTVSRNPLIDRLNAGRCEWCGATDKAYEVHHRKPLRDLGPNASPLDQALVGRNRRRIVLCVDCHQQAHAHKPPVNRRK